FVKDGNKNRLRDQDIHKIVDVFNHQTEIEGYSRMVSFNEIEENDYNLNIPRYIDKQDEEDIQDIGAHLHGGIPNSEIETLSDYWKVYPTIRNILFKETDRPSYSELNVELDQIKDTIFNHYEFITFKNDVYDHFSHWKNKHETLLFNLSSDSVPKDIINEI